MSDKNIKDTGVKKESSIKRKLKYGSVAWTMTIIFVAVIFFTNVVTSVIHHANPMLIDMTKKQIYTISDASRELLKDIDAPVRIVFFMDIDLYAKTIPGGQMIVNTVKQYAQEFDFITIESIDLIKNPAAVHEFTTSDLSRPRTFSIAVKSGDMPRLLRYDAFYVMAQSTGNAMGYAGERLMTSTILQVTNDDAPLAYFTTGHGETLSYELYSLLTLEGFRVATIDLALEDIDPEARLLIINNPLKDFIGADPDDPTKRSEIDKVSSFLNNFGNVMFFTSPEALSPMTELDGLLREYNIQFMHGARIIDMRNGLDTNGISLSAVYHESGGVGDTLHESIRNLPSAPRTVVPDVKPVLTLDLARDVRVSSVLKSADTAQILDMHENKYIAQGALDLMLVATKTQIVNNEQKSSHLLVSGSSSFLDALNNSAYSNDDIILNALRLMTRRRVSTGIEWKEFDSNALSMTLEQESNWSLIILFVIPAIPAIAGIVVWIRRRHS